MSLYIVESATGEIYQSQRYFDIPEPRVRWKVEEGTIVAAHVASKKELVMIDDILQDERFPMGIGQKGIRPLECLLDFKRLNFQINSPNLCSVYQW